MENKLEESPLELVWKKEIGDVKKVHIINSYIVIAITDKCLYIFDIDGRLRWKHTGDKITASFISNNHVIIGLSEFKDYEFLSDNYLFLFDIDGNLQWKYKLPSNKGQVCTIHASKDYVAISLEGNEIHVLDIIKGNMLWEHECEHHVFSTYILCNNVAVGTYFGKLHLFDIKGNLKWTRLLEDEPELFYGWDKYILTASAGLSLFDIEGNMKWEMYCGFVDSIDTSGEYIAIGGNYMDEMAKCVRLLDTNGRLKWQYKIMNNYMIGSICIDEKHIAACGDDGSIYIFDIKGKLECKLKMPKRNVIRCGPGIVMSSSVPIANEDDYFQSKYVYIKGNYFLYGSNEGVYLFRINNKKLPNK